MALSMKVGMTSDKLVDTISHPFERIVVKDMNSHRTLISPSSAADPGSQFNSDEVNSCAEILMAHQ